MPDPTFNSAALFDKAARDLPGSIAPRVYTDHLPGASGEYVQLHGRGPRTITATGWLEEADKSSAVVAHQAIKAKLRTRQALADGTTVAAYVGTDGHSYEHCILMSYEAADAPRIIPTGSTYKALLHCRATLRQLLP